MLVAFDVVYTSFVTHILARELALIEQFSQDEQHHAEAQKHVKHLPGVLLAALIMYGILGPNSGLLRKETRSAWSRRL